MIERVTRYSQEHPQDTLLWFSIEIERKRVALFRCWAQHLDLSDADLAARIFTAGIMQCATDDTDDPALMLDGLELEHMAETTLDDLERHLNGLPITKEGQHAADHN